jgi:uncharacterized protein YegL
MKSDSAFIAVVLDRSGSMSIVKDATIDGFNEFINGQKQQPGEAHLLLVQFDSIDPHEIVIDAPLTDVPNLTKDTFSPRENTPLHDAMGWTIIEVGERLEKMPEEERPEKVIIVILTDGHENASKEFTKENVANMVKHQTEKYNWTFIFLGANQNAVLTAKGFNISADTSMSYNNNPSSTQEVYLAVSANTSAVRRGLKASFTSAQRKAAKQ